MIHSPQVTGNLIQYKSIYGFNDRPRGSIRYPLLQAPIYSWPVRAKVPSLHLTSNISYKNKLLNGLFDDPHFLSSCEACLIETHSFHY